MLKLYMHPLASYCWKVLLALYERDIPFSPIAIDLSDPAQKAKLVAVSPFARFPVLLDGDTVVHESSIIIEHLARHHGGVPAEALELRARDRFFDTYVMDPMGRITREILKPTDEQAVADAKQTLATAYELVEGFLGKTFAVGETFTLADCAAIPSLFYADYYQPITQPRTRAYLDRMLARPSMMRVRAEAEPYWQHFPGAKLKA